MPTLRAATAADLGAIAAIHARAIETSPAVFRDAPLPPEDWAAWLLSDHPTRVVEVDGEVLGFIAVRPYAPGYSGYVGMAWLSLYVRERTRGQGLGRALLRASLGRLADHGRRGAVVWVLAANPSRFFYERLGGRRVATRRELFANTLLDELAYAWDGPVVA